jgi:hypothetical protein
VLFNFAQDLQFPAKGLKIKFKLESKAALRAITPGLPDGIFSNQKSTKIR